MPKVSVVIPNYNHAPFLDQRIQSVLAQTYQDFDIIFLDDASTDESQRVFSCYEQDPRIAAHFNPVTSGTPFRQWNKGMRNSG